MSGIPTAHSGSWKKWRSTSGAKSGPVRSTCPLEEFRSVARQFLEHEASEGLVAQFDGFTPNEDDFQVLLGMWITMQIKSDQESLSELLHFVAPYMKEEAVQRWQDRYSAMTVGRNHV